MAFITFDGYISKLTIAQDSALGSNTQVLMGGSVTTAAPTYTTGNINPISLTVAGAVRVDNSANTQPVSGTVAVSNSFALDATLTTLSGKFVSAATLADAESNPSAGSIATYLKVFNGTTWDRLRSGNSATLSSITGFLNNVGYGIFNQSGVGLTNGQFSPLQVDSSGYLRTHDGYHPLAEDNTNGVLAVMSLPLATSTYAPTVSSGIGALPGNIKATAGNLISVTITNLNSTAKYLQLFNSASTPSGTPLHSFLIPGSGIVSLGTDVFTVNGIFFSTGITVGFSTASNTYTAGTAADCNYTVIFK